MIWRDHVISGTNRQRRIGGSWRQRGLVGAIALILAIVAAGVYLFLPPLPTDMRLPRTDLRLAVWLGVTWSNDAHSPSEIRALAAELQSQRVSDLFIYVSYLKADGNFNSTYGHAAEFVRQMRSLAPEMRLLAWIGVPTTPSAANDDSIASRLHDAEIRQAIADFSSFAVTDLGFDGVHLNIEPVTNDDPAFLDTLTDVRGSLPADALGFRRPRIPCGWIRRARRCLIQRSRIIGHRTISSALPSAATRSRSWLTIPDCLSPGIT